MPRHTEVLEVLDDGPPLPVVHRLALFQQQNFVELRENVRPGLVDRTDHNHPLTGKGPQHMRDAQRGAGVFPRFCGVRVRVRACVCSYTGEEQEKRTKKKKLAPCFVSYSFSFSSSQASVQKGETHVKSGVLRFFVPREVWW